MSNIVEIFGVAVRQLREARGWSQEQLFEQANLNRSYVGEIERGRAIASIVTAEKLAHPPCCRMHKRAMACPTAR